LTRALKRVAIASTGIIQYSLRRRALRFDKPQCLAHTFSAERWGPNSSTGPSCLRVSARKCRSEEYSAGAKPESPAPPAEAADRFFVRDDKGRAPISCKYRCHHTRSSQTTAATASFDCLSGPKPLGANHHWRPLSCLPGSPATQDCEFFRAKSIMSMPTENSVLKSTLFSMHRELNETAQSRRSGRCGLGGHESILIYRFDSMTCDVMPVSVQFSTLT
jgi:hypothetical protein